jgi:D-alanine-D-alanine ligase
MKKFTVALLYNSKQNAPHTDGEPWDAWNELDSEKTAGQIERALRAGGHEVIAMEGGVTLPQKLDHYKIDIAFNICEGHYGGSREAQVPAMLDMLRIPYTGAGVMALAVSLDKPMAKRVMAFHGLPTPLFQVFITGEEAVDSRRELREQVHELIRAYRQPALVEEYIEGREFTLGLLGNVTWNARPRHNRPMHAVEPEMALAGAENGARKSPRGNGNGRGATTARRSLSLSPETQPALRVFPPLEVDLSPCPEDQAGLYTSVIKSQMYDVPKYLCPAPTTKALRAKLERLAVNAFAALECCDFARVDFRVRGETGEPLILEVNPLAGLQEGISDIVMGAEAVGVDYTALINGILNAALERYGMI